MADIQIAPTTQAQLEAVLDQTRATFQTHRARFPKAFPDQILLKLEEIHRDAVDLAGDKPTSFCAQLRGETTGFVLLRPKKRACLVYDIGVFPRFRRQGVARALVRHAVSVARDRRWHLLMASVWDGNASSHQLFQSAGFKRQTSLFDPLAMFFQKSNVTIYCCDPGKMPKI